MPFWHFGEGYRKGNINNPNLKRQNENSACSSPEIVKDVQKSGFQKSVYGKENLISYLQKHKQQDIRVIDIEKAKQLSLNIGLQLPQPPTALDYNKTLTDSEQHVNPQNVLKFSGVNLSLFYN